MLDVMLVFKMHALWQLLISDCLLGVASLDELICCILLIAEARLLSHDLRITDQIGYLLLLGRGLVAITPPARVDQRVERLSSLIGKAGLRR